MREFLRRHGVHVECHAGEAVAAEVGRETEVSPAAVRLQVEPTRHAVHGVDLTPQLRHEKHVEHTRRRDPQFERYPCRNDHVVDTRDVLLRINEQPLPVERHHLDLQRLGLGLQRLGRVEQVGADPGDATQEEDDKRRNRPDDELKLSGVSPFGQVPGARVGDPEPVREGEYRHNRRHNNGEHDRQRIEQHAAHPLPHRARRREHGGVTCGK